MQQLPALHLIGFDSITSYKVGLYWEGERKGYLKIGDEHIEVKPTNLVKSQGRRMDEQVIQPYYSVRCKVKLRQNQRNKVHECLYFFGIDKILFEEPFIQVHDVITQVKARKNI